MRLGLCCAFSADEIRFRAISAGAFGELAPAECRISEKSIEFCARKALGSFRAVERLSDRAQQRLALENDDRTYSPQALLLL